MWLLTNTCWTWANDVSLLQRGHFYPEFHLTKYPPSTQLWWGHTCSAVSSSGLPTARETWTVQRESKKGPQRCCSGWSIIPIRKVWETWGCSAWGEGGYGTISININTWRKGAGIIEPGPFQWCPVTPRHKAIHTKQKTRDSLWISWDLFFYCEHWSRLHKEVGESPSLETVKWPLDMVLGNWLHLALFEQRSLPTSAILWVCDSVTTGKYQCTRAKLLAGFCLFW